MLKHRDFAEFIGQVPVPPKQATGATLVVVHNHPSGDPTPSKADIAMTREVAKAAETLGLTVHDHIVIGRSGHASFKGMGLL